MTQTAGRVSWTDAHRLEAALRARAQRLGRVGMDPSRCPGCGGLIGDDEHVRLAGARIHAECLQVCRDEPPGGGLPVA
jgi:hypothetical protein